MTCSEHGSLGMASLLYGGGFPTILFSEETKRMLLGLFDLPLNVSHYDVLFNLLDPSSFTARKDYTKI